MTDTAKKAYTVTFTDDTGVESTVCYLATNYFDVDQAVRASREGHVEITKASYKYPIDLTE